MQILTSSLEPLLHESHAMVVQVWCVFQSQVLPQCPVHSPGRPSEEDSAGVMKLEIHTLSLLDLLVLVPSEERRHHFDNLSHGLDLCMAHPVGGGPIFSWSPFVPSPNAITSPFPRDHNRAGCATPVGPSQRGDTRFHLERQFFCQCIPSDDDAVQ